MARASTNQSSHQVVSYDELHNALFAYGRDVPSARPGFATGCVFAHVDGSTGTATYINEGDATSCTFTAIEPPGSILASEIAITDAGGFTSAATVEAALAEHYQHLFSVSGGHIDLPLTAWREVDASGDVGNIVANGGVLASDTTPILLGDAAEALNIRWAATVVDPIAIGIALPSDYDDTADMLLDIRVKAAGTTNAPSFTVETSWDGGAKVSDTATGAASASIQTATATIAAADVPAGAVALTIGLTPGAHGTDAWDVYAVRLRYKRKLLTA